MSKGQKILGKKDGNNKKNNNIATVKTKKGGDRSCIRTKIRNIVTFLPRVVRRAFGKFSRSLNITSKTLLVYGTVYLILSVLIGVSVIAYNQTAVKDRNVHILNNQVNAVINALQDNSDIDALEKLDNMREIMSVLDIFVVIEGSDGVFWSSAVSGTSAYKNAQDSIKYGEYTMHGSMVYHATAINTPDTEYALYSVKMLGRDYAFLIKSRILLGVIMPVSFFVLLAVGGMLGKGFLSPVREMINKTKKINSKNISDVRLEAGRGQDELKELVLVINNMLDNLQESFEAQDRFISDASHELKTPIAVLRGYSDMLLRWGRNDPEILEESVLAIKNETDHMKSLVEMLMFLSKANADSHRLKPSEFGLDELVYEVIKELQMTNNTHTINTGKLDALHVVADRQLIKQLVRIISENAIKYTADSGTITFSCYQDDESAYVVVQDTGTGISQQDLPHIFDRFYRADKSRNREGGSGLGLAIAKKIADAHMADILVSSTQGVGTIVNIKLPKTVMLSDQIIESDTDTIN